MASFGGISILSLMRFALLAVLALVLGGCGLVSRVGVGWFYDTADLPEAQVRRDVAYLDDGDPKHRLNLFLPAPGSPTRPTVVFVHGGNWDSGDRDLTAGGRDVYNNVGRYLASNGIPTAVISYPFPSVAGGAAVDWRAEARSVAAAMAYVRREQGTWGSRGIVGMGHSAGTHLVLHASLNPAFSGPVGRVCGLVPASGAGLDLTAEGAFVGDTYDFFSSRFAPDRVTRTEPPAVPADWQREISVVHPNGTPASVRRYRMIAPCRMPSVGASAMENFSSGGVMRSRFSAAAKKAKTSARGRASVIDVRSVWRRGIGM